MLPARGLAGSASIVQRSDMEEELASLTEQTTSFWAQAQSQAQLLLLPSRLYQVGILLVCILLAILLLN